MQEIVKPLLQGGLTTAGVSYLGKIGPRDDVGIQFLGNVRVPVLGVAFAAGAGASLLADLSHTIIHKEISKNKKLEENASMLSAGLISIGLLNGLMYAVHPTTVSEIGVVNLSAIGLGSEYAGSFVASMIDE